MKKKKPQQNEIQKLILEELKEFAVELDTINIRVEKGPKVFVEGEIFNHEDRIVIRRVIEDVTGTDDIVEDLVLIENEYDDGNIDRDASTREDPLKDDDYEETEDVFESIEDGIPYTPPTEAVYRKNIEDDNPFPKKKKKKRS